MDPHQMMAGDRIVGTPTRGARVLLVTSSRRQCGIREYGVQLARAASDGIVEVTEFPHEHPDTLFAFLDCPQAYDVVHLNHHAALHSAWRPSHLEKLKEMGYGVVVTQHDTFEEWAIMRERRMADFTCADVLVFHEFVSGMPASASMGSGRSPVVLSQGVPWMFEEDEREAAARRIPRLLCLFGFDFPWKGFDLAVQAAHTAGWGVRILSAGMSHDRWTQLATGYGPLPLIELYDDWLPTERTVQLLAECSATAFLYSCGNSGTSGAIRTGIAARVPLIAMRGCRQFRDLEYDAIQSPAITWVSSVTETAEALRRLEDSTTWDRRRAGIRMLAATMSWYRIGGRYQEIYHEAQGAARRRELKRESRRP